MHNENGLPASFGLALIAVIAVSVVLAIAFAVARLAPALMVVLEVGRRSLSLSIIVWVCIAIIALFTGTVVSSPSRFGDTRFYLLFGFLYGGVSGVFFWVVSGRNVAVL